MSQGRSSFFIKLLSTIRMPKLWNKAELNDYTYEKILELLLKHSPYDDIANLLEHTFLKNIITLRNKRVNDVMIPRVDIVAADYDSTAEDILSLMQKNGFSRIPIFKEDLDYVVGFIHVKDLIPILRKNSALVMSSFLRQVIFISPYMKLFDLFLEMKIKRTHLAIVVDEFGGVDGLLTIEDILEEIVGEITDEYDKIPTVMIKVIDSQTLETYGRVEIEELENLIGSFSSDEEKDEFNTLAGLIVAFSGYIPSKNEIISHPSGIEFEILSADAVKINKVLVRHAKLLKKQKKVRKDQ